MLRLAVERDYEIIGEALRRIELRFPTRFLSIRDGRKIIDFRNLLAHGYDDVADEIVWAITTSNIDVLRRDVTKILEENQ